MCERVVNFTVAEEGQALGVASDLLHTPPENIQLHGLGDGAFRAHIINANAELEIEMSPDQMKARVMAYAPPLGDGTPLDVQMIHAQLAAAGVGFGIDAAEIDRLIERIAKGCDVRGSILARGYQPQPPQDARLEPLGDLHRPVLPGMMICRKLPLAEAQSGRAVTGKELPYMFQARAKDLTMVPHDGVKVVEGGTVAVATTYGLARIRDARVEVEPRFTVSPDRLTTTATIYALDSHHEAITTERMRETLKSLALVYGFDAAVCAEALAKAQEQTTDKQAGSVADVARAWPVSSGSIA